MSDKARIEIVPPLTGAELVEEQDRLLRRRLTGRATPEDLARLVELPGEIAAAEAESRIVLVLQVASRRGGFRRGGLLRRAVEWLEEQGYAGADWEAIPEETRESFVVLQQAADIAGALVPEECRNFTPPAEVDGWLGLPDYIYAAALPIAWQLNPHWLPRPAADEGDDAKN